MKISNFLSEKMRKTNILLRPHQIIFLPFWAYNFHPFFLPPLELKNKAFILCFLFSSACFMSYSESISFDYSHPRISYQFLQFFESGYIRLLVEFRLLEEFRLLDEIRFACLTQWTWRTDGKAIAKLVDEAIFLSSKGGRKGESYIPKREEI